MQPWVCASERSDAARRMAAMPSSLAPSLTKTSQCSASRCRVRARVVCASVPRTRACVRACGRFVFLASWRPRVFRSPLRAVADSIFDFRAQRRSQVEPAIARPISVGLSHGLLVRGRRRAMWQRRRVPAQPCFTLAFLPAARAAVGCVCRSAPCHDHVHGLAGPAPSCTATVGCAVAVPVQRVAHRLSWAHKLTHTHAVAQMVAHARVRRS